MKKIGLQYKEIIYLSDGVEIVIPTKKWGEVSLFIDKEDLDRVLKVGWCVRKPKQVFYCYGIGVDKSICSIHRFILNFPNCKIIDHKDRNGLNNRKSNLRIATASQNAANSIASSKKKVPWKGVSFKPKKNLYIVQLVKDGVKKDFGLFKNPLLAAAKYNEVAIQYHGEFARLNEFTEEQKREIENPPKEQMRKYKTNVTGFIGVSLKTKGRGVKRYTSTIFHNGKNIFLGHFMTPKEAAIAYNKAALQYKGDKATINNIAP